MERHLAAIVCADIAGYSRMMGVDEAGTHASFKAHRSAIYPIILNHGGRLVKNTGDGFLLEFPSIVGAIEAAIAMQMVMAERNNHLPADRAMHFRMGIHMGDVMADEDELFGDDVNIAVRLESVAPAGGIAVSEKAYTEAGRHLTVSMADAGPHRFKNIEEPVNVWIWAPAGSDGRDRESKDNATDGAKDGSNLPAQYRTAIVGVLPFDNLSGSADEYFFRWLDRRSDPRAVAAVVLSRAEPERDLRLQGHKRQPASDRARDRRDLFDPGLGAARRKQDPSHRRTDRTGEWRAIMDRSI